MYLLNSHSISTNYPIGTFCVDFLDHIRTISFGSELAAGLVWDNDWPPYCEHLISNLKSMWLNFFVECS